MCKVCATAITVLESPHAANQIVEMYRSVRNDITELTRNELDLVVVAQLIAGCFLQNQNRMQTHTQPSTIMERMFLLLHAIGYWQFKALKGESSFKRPVLSTSWEQGMQLEDQTEIEEVVQFIMNYAGKCMHIVQQ